MIPAAVPANLDTLHARTSVLTPTQTAAVDAYLVGVLAERVPAREWSRIVSDAVTFVQRVVS